MLFSRRTCCTIFASVLVLASILGGTLILHFTSLQARAASNAPLGQTIWLVTTNNNQYVSARTDQTNAPLDASVTQVQGWEQFDVVDAGNGYIALRAHANKTM